MHPALERLLCRAGLPLAALILTFCWSLPLRAESTPVAAPVFSMSPIGWVRKAGGRTFIEVEPRYQAALLGVDELSSLWVFWWFDRNDAPERRAILQVHPRGNPDNPLRGVFATRSPFRPNLIALTQVKLIAVRGNMIEIGDIDAFADTPVLDLKP
ncbi:MAG: SAM-dependent methyltransferase [Rhodocyclales bacterium]|nr:SAM-dependent methyltransferase [Rhodocyclales bacterium]